MVITFTCSSSPHPIGGVSALYEFANALSRRGHDVHILHAPFFGVKIESLDELSWFRFEPAISHQIVDTDDPEFPAADVMFGTGAPPEAGLPVHLVQGIEMLFPWLEHEAFRTPALKVCVASWLVTSGERFGVPPEHFDVVHMGIHHERYRVTVPLADRPPQVAMLFHAHPAKGTAVGLAALEEARRRVPELRVALFGTSEPTEPLPDWATFTLKPAEDVLVEQIYNRSRICLQASDYEGFGLTAVEAMACGCALVTTDNGGSHDYAVPDRTALVAEPRDVATLADHIVRLLTDDAERVRIAEAGGARAREFDWAVAGAEMEHLLERYVADPAAYQRPPGPVPDPPTEPG